MKCLFFLKHGIHSARQFSLNRREADLGGSQTYSFAHTKQRDERRKSLKANFLSRFTLLYSMLVNCWIKAQSASVSASDSFPGVSLAL